IPKKRDLIKKIHNINHTNICFFKLIIIILSGIVSPCEIGWPNYNKNGGFEFSNIVKLKKTGRLSSIVLFLE
ncbi:MAG: hypothetical protein Q8862_10915, partial [Bacteroidota bacterium]|nr:hypothetical protein [Bacteroidota bacterium]